MSKIKFAVGTHSVLCSYVIDKRELCFGLIVVLVVSAPTVLGLFDASVRRAHFVLCLEEGDF